jgi:hypothetical protein
MTRFPLFYYYTHRLSCITKQELDGTLYNQCDKTAYTYLYSNTIVPYSNSANGSMVGYQKIAERTNGNGYIEYYYEVHPDEFDFTLDRLPANATSENVFVGPTLGSIFQYTGPQYLPGVPSSGNVMNGKLWNVKYYGEYKSDNYGGLRKSVEYKYQILKPQILWNFKLLIDRFSNQTYGIKTIILDQSPFNLCFYPDVISKVVQTKAITTDYFTKVVTDPVAGNIPVTRQLKQTTETIYENNHLFPTQEIQTSSDPNSGSYSTLYSYPQDAAMASEPFRDDLIAKNMIASPLKKEAYKNAKKSSEQTTKYGLYADINANNTLLLPQFIYNAKGEQNPEKRITYDYDNQGNIKEYKLEAGPTTVILWGYNRTQPIAKIGNATYAQVASALGTTVVELQKFDESRLTAINGLRGSMPDAQVTTLTYTTLKGISTVTDPKGDMMYYNYDVAGKLINVRDKNNNILSENQYHYKN